MDINKQPDNKELYIDLISHPDGVIDFSFGNPNPETFPMAEIRAATNNITINDLQYIPNLGHTDLRHGIGNWLSMHSNINVDTNNILVTNGSMEGISLATSLLATRTNFVITEQPSYWRALEIFQFSKTNLSLVDVHAGGMDTKQLETVLYELYSGGNEVAFLYCIPSFQNPTGQTLNLDSRQRLLDLATQFDFYILEDSAYEHLGFEPSLPSLYSLCKDDRVILLGTLSKVICPGLRIGWLIAPSKLVSRLAAIKPDGGTNPLASTIANRLLKIIHWNDHLALLTNFYKSRYEVMENCLDRIGEEYITWLKPTGGFFVWLKLSERIDLCLFDQHCQSRNVALLRGRANGKNCSEYSIRLAFSNLNHDEIRMGISQLHEVLIASIK